MKNLTLFLHRVYGKRTVVLIDEVDVPLQNAGRGGFHPEMLDMTQGMLHGVLKINSENLQFALVAGCLPVDWECIHPAANTVLSLEESNVLGFTVDEVQDLLKHNGLAERFKDVRDWYEGYQFGKTVIYNP